MRTFNEFLKQKDGNFFKEIYGEQDEQPKEESPVDKYKRMSADAMKGFKPETDKPKDEKEAAYMQSWRKSKKK